MSATKIEGRPRPSLPSAMASQSRALAPPTLSTARTRPSGPSAKISGTPPESLCVYDARVPGARRETAGLGDPLVPDGERDPVVVRAAAPAGAAFAAGRRRRRTRNGGERGTGASDDAAC